MIWLPGSYLSTFTLDVEQGHYILEACIPSNALIPHKLAVENKRFNGDTNLLLSGIANEEVTRLGLIEDHSSKLITSLQSTHHEGVYIGNSLTYRRNNKRVRSGIIARFTADMKRMSLRYFPGYYPYPDLRDAFVAEVISRGMI